MKEDLLHFAWKFQLFELENLQTQLGEPVTVKKVGFHNKDAGPDFMNARVAIGETLWAGNVEIHIRTSDWFRHGHHQDKAYDNVILHVVFEDDSKPGQDNYQLKRIPCLEVANLLPNQLLSRYNAMLTNQKWVPCADHFPGVPELTTKHWLNRVLIERIEQKASYLHELLKANNNDWRETFYQLMARNFGFKVNAEPFEHLAKTLPLKTLTKHKDQLHQVEALLFGQAGMLNHIFTDQYPIDLQEEYRFLSQKYGLTPIGEHEWNLLRLRPANFPAIRIAQLAALLHQTSGIFAKVLEIKDSETIKKLFQVKASKYWDDHYQFDRPSTNKRPKQLGKKARENILINTVVPFLFAYGQAQNDDSLQEKAVDMLESLPPEQNSILKNWQQLGAKNGNAANSQALLYLKKAYCDQKRCLECGIGTKVLSSF